MYNSSIPTLLACNLFSNPTDFLQADVSFSKYEIKHSIWKYVGNLIPGLITFSYLGLYCARILEKTMKFQIANTFKGLQSSCENHSSQLPRQIQFLRIAWALRPRRVFRKQMPQSHIRETETEIMELRRPHQHQDWERHRNSTETRPPCFSKHMEFDSNLLFLMGILILN